MAATTTLDHSAISRNSSNRNQNVTHISPRNGVATLYGYGINVRVERGHLLCEDGIGSERRHGRFPRVAHGLRRLIVIGADGMISLSALRWLADQNASFVMLERDGSVLATTGPVRPSDAKLRRAQSTASQTGTNITIARYLIEQKLVGQERVARERLTDAVTADKIADFRRMLADAETIATIRQLESQGAALYWAGWANLPITFPAKDLPRVPEHWRMFGTRKSPITGSQRLAVNPPNAMLNYLYAILESESRLAAAALGLDPGIGFIHVDTPARDSLACDLMEAIRPQVDGFVLDWIRSGLLKREWFFEERNGNCRLMASLTEKLSETATTWARAVAPFAEWIARVLWQRTSKPERETPPATRLTQQRKREAKGSALPTIRVPRLEHFCPSCGQSIHYARKHCLECEALRRKERLKAVGESARIKAHTPNVIARVAETQRRHAAARSAWKPKILPAWLNRETYLQRILPLLKNVQSTVIAYETGVSRPYAVQVRHGKRIPHPRHWLALAQLVGVSE